MHMPAPAGRTDSTHVDLLDRAFLSRLAIPSEHPARKAPPPAVDEAGVAMVARAAPVETVETVQKAIETAAEPPPAEDVVGKLLDMAPREWAAVAEAIEDDARGRGGRSVVAVVARRSGDGCTTFTKALEHALRGRGHDVVTESTADMPPLDEPPGRLPAGRDDSPRGITLIDAGNWFGTGPIRRERGETLAAACHAAILLRRADRASAAAFARAVAVCGVHVLGEVATFSRGVRDQAEPETP